MSVDGMVHEALSNLELRLVKREKLARFYRVSPTPESFKVLKDSNSQILFAMREDQDLHRRWTSSPYGTAHEF